LARTGSMWVLLLQWQLPGRRENCFMKKRRKFSTGELGLPSRVLLRTCTVHGAAAAAGDQSDACQAGAKACYGCTRFFCP
jgi:hypothetical protein